MQYYYFELMDFVMDEYFQQWIFFPDESNTHFWEQWLEQHPEKKAAVEEAKYLLLLQRFEVTAWPGERMGRISRQIRVVKAKPASILPSTPSFSWLYRVAAGLALFCTAIWLVMLYLEQPVRYTTDFGETLELILPDGSTAHLNANSSITFSRNWDNKRVREVWLEGEAYFHVQKKKAPQYTNSPVKFIVHLSEVSLEVLGTEFNVNNREGQVKVVLTEGKVDVLIESRERLQMHPGEMVEFSRSSRQLSRRQVNPEQHSSWKSHVLVFKEQSLKEVALRLEEIYGMEIYFQNPALAEQKITGTLPSNQPEVILKSLQAIYSLKIRREKNTLVLE